MDRRFSRFVFLLIDPRAVRKKSSDIFFHADRNGRLCRFGFLRTGSYHPHIILAWFCVLPYRDVDLIALHLRHKSTRPLTIYFTHHCHRVLIRGLLAIIDRCDLHIFFTGIDRRLPLPERDLICKVGGLCGTVDSVRHLRFQRGVLVLLILRHTLKE